MTVWIALLRGVNVGGITIRSADLADLFRSLELEGVRTVLASGNVRFETGGGASARAKLKSRIEKALRERFGYDAWIVLVTADELAKAIERFPFDEEDSSRQPWVIFCSDGDVAKELADAAASVDDQKADPTAFEKVSPHLSVVYWNPVKGTTTDTAFAKVLAKARYKSTTTNRNLRTLAKLVD
ncbi:DUF1697 domain-containing protein [Microbacterium sp.]|uniref:DUF1697 domain-containing protein n=1 Tax=Microbacterium sp. TaxID=51671 RepID=UPI002D77B018|nr:DUF1697 domain-containing protein [Microbacterium sp.]HET6302902.1 DUF1697 domain-containing protein [Microbacterium sp.]